MKAETWQRLLEANPFQPFSMAALSNRSAMVARKYTST